MDWHPPASCLDSKFGHCVDSWETWDKPNTPNLKVTGFGLRGYGSTHSLLRKSYPRMFYSNIDVDGAKTFKTNVNTKGGVAILPASARWRDWWRSCGRSEGRSTLRRSSWLRSLQERWSSPWTRTRKQVWSGRKPSWFGTCSCLASFHEWTSFLRVTLLLTTSLNAVMFLSAFLSSSNTFKLTNRQFNPN